MFEWHGKLEAKIPRVLPVKQKFPSESVEDVEKAIAAELAKDEIVAHLKPGLKVALAVGSRGIGRLDEIVRAVVSELKQRGMEVFIVPSMGSHGGARAEGQEELLAGYNITEATVGAPIKSSMEVVTLGEIEPGFPVYVDKIATSEADLIIPIARVKNHTSFRGDVESGMYKMLCIGLGKHKGAQSIHKQGFDRFKELIPKVGQFILDRIQVPFGIALVENAEELPALIEAVAAADWKWREPELLQLSRKLMAQIYFRDLDILVVREIGKNISGSGMDPNITGRFRMHFIKDGPLMVQKIVVLGLTEETHGNATGIGISDITTKEVVEKIDFHSTYTNCITSTRLDGAKLPVVMPNDFAALTLAVMTANRVAEGQARMVFINNTLELERIYVSEPLLAEVKANPNMEVLGEPQELTFDAEGKLLLPKL
ncbi:MAG: lactate racemase domain-containing protein [bacterium]